MEQKSPNIIAVVVVACIVVLAAMMAVGPHTQVGTAWTAYRVQKGVIDYRLTAYNDAQDNGISAKLFLAQINEESGFNPNAVSDKGAIGIAQILPSTAAGWGVDPHDPVASLQAAAKAMATYQSAYGAYDKALAAYNAGTGTLDSALSRCGYGWYSCLPLETRTYITAIMGAS